MDDEDDPTLPGTLLGEAEGVEALLEREEEEVGCLLCPDPPLLLTVCFLGDEEEIEEEVRVEVDLEGGGFLVPCWEGVRCL